MLFVQISFAQEDLSEMSIEELLNINVSVASYKTSGIREQPGIITVITREEIKKSGARDLIDIINLVPGFGFAARCR